MKDTKIYGLCLERLKFQIDKACERLSQGKVSCDRGILLESYQTAHIDDIIDILELYDIEDHSPEGLQEKLEELAYTASVLMRKRIYFGSTPEGHLGIYVDLAVQPSALREDVPAAAVLSTV